MSDEEEYVVEKIVGCRTKKGRVEYRIRWKGYDESDDTWEPAENLQKVQKLIREYELIKSDENRRNQKKLLMQQISKMNQVNQESSLTCAIYKKKKDDDDNKNSKICKTKLKKIYEILGPPKFSSSPLPEKNKTKRKRRRK